MKIDQLKRNDVSGGLGPASHTMRGRPLVWNT